MTEQQYIMMQQDLKGRNCNVFPPYYKINELKKKLMPDGITHPKPGTFEIPMQQCLNNLMEGIIDDQIRAKIEQFALDPDNEFQAIFKTGADGASGLAQHSRSSIDQKTIFASFLVPLMIKVKNSRTKKSNYLYLNRMANSWTAVCYLRLAFEQETPGIWLEIDIKKIKN